MGSQTSQEVAFTFSEEELQELKDSCAFNDGQFDAVVGRVVSNCDSVGNLDAGFLDKIFPLMGNEMLGLREQYLHVLGAEDGYVSAKKFVATLSGLYEDDPLQRAQFVGDLMFAGFEEGEDVAIDLINHEFFKWLSLLSDPGPPSVRDTSACQHRFAVAFSGIISDADAVRMTPKAADSERPKLTVDITATQHKDTKPAGPPRRVKPVHKPKKPDAATAAAAAKLYVERKLGSAVRKEKLSKTEFVQWVLGDSFGREGCGLRIRVQNCLEKFAQQQKRAEEGEPAAVVETAPSAVTNHIEGYCSWCFFKTWHGMTAYGGVGGRASYTCMSCLRNTVGCIIPQCAKLAREGFLHCARHTIFGVVQVDHWGQGLPKQCKDFGLCSWCGTEAEQAILPFDKQRLHTCASCNQRTNRCLTCLVAFAPSFTPYHYEDCSTCLGLTPGNRRNNPYESSYPLHENVFFRPLVDGVEAYPAMARAMLNAEHVIYISAWFLSPWIYLERNPLRNRLDVVLQQKAAAGVRVYVLIWAELTVAYNRFSADAEAHLKALHPNISVLRHPFVSQHISHNSFFQSHHQKFVVCDEEYAFLGGLDMCVGRYDDHAHSMTDPKAEVYLGLDYFNPRIMPSTTDINTPFADHPDKDREAMYRLPWHDVHCEVRGPAARDVAANFIQRWNHHRDELINPLIHLDEWFTTSTSDNDSNGPPSPKIQAKSPPARAAAMSKMKSNMLTSGSSKIRVIRSIASWSGGSRLERSIYGAYLRMIDAAEHFVYIENQFVTSSVAGGGIENKVAVALLRRVRRAIKNSETFRCFIVQSQPFEAGTADNCILRWQLDTLFRGENSMVKQLEKEFPTVALTNYFSFCYLRTHALMPNGSMCTDQVFLHSKLLIVDDRMAIISSANLNDRSFLGDRDSELGVEILAGGDTVESVMAGKTYNVERAVRDLRITLWKEFLGTDASVDLRDAVCDEVYREVWCARARTNGAIYRKVFSEVPRDSYKCWQDVQAAIEKAPDAISPQLLENVRGFLIDIPWLFLEKDFLQPSLLSIEYYLNYTMFQ